jgi:hypothetical protein
MRAALLLSLLLATACSSSSEGGAGGSGGAGGGDAAEDDQALDGEGGADGEDPNDEGGTGGEADSNTPDPNECVGDRPTGACVYEGFGDVGYCCNFGTWGCCPTPLVLSFDDAPITYASHDLVAFDLTGDGVSIATDWPSSDTPWLALDRDGDGAIADGKELFGSAVRLATGRMASNGFEALAELDDNGDGRIDASDARFGDLSVWTDVDADRTTDGGELIAAGGGARRVVSIDLAYHVRRECDARGNCGVERAAFVWADASGREHLGEVIDVHLPTRSR